MIWHLRRPVRELPICPVMLRFEGMSEEQEEEEESRFRQRLSRYKTALIKVCNEQILLDIRRLFVECYLHHRPHPWNDFASRFEIGLERGSDALFKTKLIDVPPDPVWHPSQHEEAMERHESSPIQGWGRDCSRVGIDLGKVYEQREAHQHSLDFEDWMRRLFISLGLERGEL